jgi:hypothetical protein
VTTNEPFAERQIRAAVSESASRDENERTDEFRGKSALTTYTCECAKECVVLVSLTNDEYDEVRSVPTHFLAAPGHLVIGVEVVVRESARYIVVEKIGAAAAVASDLDTHEKTMREPHAA